MVGLGVNKQVISRVGLAGRPNTAICCVSEKIQAAYVCRVHRTPGIFSLHVYLIILSGWVSEIWKSQIRQG